MAHEPKVLNSPLHTARHGFVKRLNFVCSSCVWKCLSLLLLLLPTATEPFNTSLCVKQQAGRQLVILLLLIDHLLLLPSPPSTLTRRHKNNTSSWPTTTTKTPAQTVSQSDSYLSFGPGEKEREECRECVARFLT